VWVATSGLPRFVILPRNRVSGVLLSPERRAAVSALVSISNPGDRPPSGVRTVPCRLLLEFDDVAEPTEPGAPAAEDVRRLIAFARQLRDAESVLVHCEAGISRSPAAAIILAAALLDPGREDAAAAAMAAVAAVFEVAPWARPNRLMLRLADAELGHGRALEEALDAEYKRRFG
jgi:predicted protein tyrosine phosphatase